MAGGVMAAQDGGTEFPGRLTMHVKLCSLIAAFGGLMFGYDIGISGGVTSMDSFLEKFFPAVYRKKHEIKEDNYCKFNNQFLQLFTSSLYLSATVCCFFASKSCNKFGRKRTMQAASAFFLIGSICNGLAQNLAMLIVGRLLLGAGIGFGNQAVPLFISEIAPANYRGALNIMFQLLITVGILVANLVNYITSHRPHGWRFSLGGAGVPAIFLLVGSLVIVETPTSLVQRGKKERALKTLQKIRGKDIDVDKEYQSIVAATEAAQKFKHPFRNLVKNNMPQLICGSIIQMFQQLTGINVIMFYAPVLFQTMGFKSDASLLSSVITGLINVFSTLVALFFVDKWGRRALLVESVIQMLICQVVVGIFLQVDLHATNEMPKVPAYIVVVLICAFVAGFAWSWGPLGWLIASEIFPLETRSAGFFCAVAMNMIWTFIIAQAFLSMLCAMKAAIFFFFSAWIVIMGIFAVFWLPETKGVPIDEMKETVWKKHWFWKRFFDHDEPGDAKA
ncbi:sugar transport protein 8-like [Heracleum sosnowskyi]|uniref:Sugar transport protein 8-like n=1 Tax=Heracleum sosnowskyi TaxID=360622 RepID=A0AAD8IZN7_9APIA|nr:sugar transport protein 8-like [Heracleum sosnowskyi]